MASNHASLDAAAQERKARLAKLKSLKRKQHPTDDQEGGGGGGDNEPTVEDNNKDSTTTQGDSSDVTTKFLSGRNYDPATRGPKLGFENAPNLDEDQETLEKRAAEINEATKRLAEEEEKADRPIDLFKLQPKKPNWDLKRDVERKLERLNVQTNNAIARIVRERIAEQRRKQQQQEGGEVMKGESTGRNGEDNAMGMAGGELVEGIHLREMEEAEEERRDREDDDDNEDD